MNILKNISRSLVLGLFIACSSNNKNNKQLSHKELKVKDTIITFSGHWVSKNYIDNIQKFKSPLQAQGNSKYIYIPNNTLKPTQLIANFHEGSSALTILKNTNFYELWEMEQDSIVRKLDIIEIISQHQIKIGNTNFIKINAIQKDNVPFILEEILFKGIYTATSGKTIEFKNNGTLTGLDNFTSYTPSIDYIDVGMQVNQIDLFTANGTAKRFGFKFDNNTLNIYELTCIDFNNEAEICVNVKFGKLLYQLIKRTKKLQASWQKIKPPAPTPMY